MARQVLGCLLGEKYNVLCGRCVCDWSWFRWLYITDYRLVYNIFLLLIEKVG